MTANNYNVNKQQETGLEIEVEGTVIITIEIIKIGGDANRNAIDSDDVNWNANGSVSCRSAKKIVSVNVSRIERKTRIAPKAI